MKKFVLLLFVVLSASAFATPTVTFNGMGKTGTFYGFSSGSGVYAGEMKFTANGITGVADGQFITFCIEGNELVNSGHTYNAVLNTGATHGGFGGGDPDPLGDATAWLYNDYLDNIAGNSTDALAKDYQLAIWYLEEEISDLSNFGGAQALVVAAQAAVAGVNGWVNTNIKVLNLYDADGTYKQDCLVRVTPVPGAVLLGGIGTALVGWMRRRKSL